MKRILIIEDELHLLNLYTRILESVGYVVDRAATLHAAQILLSSQSYDLCISDMKLGYSKEAPLLARLSHLQSEGMPVIVISGQDDIGEVCQTIGIDFYSKPINNTQLIAVVAEYIGSARGTGELTAQ